MCKILFASLFPILADEAYYYIWSLRPQLSYYDHPPVVSWLIYLGHVFFEQGTSLALRISFIFTSTFTSIIWVKILQKKGFPEDRILLFIFLTLLNPLLGPGSVVATPDVPLLFFWSLSYLAFITMFEESSTRKKLYYYALLGAALGLGFCSKYHIVLFVISGLATIVIGKSYKKILPFGVILTVICGFVFSLPVLIWNYQNDWASFGFQLKHGFGKPFYDWHWTADFYLGQFALLSPLVFLNLFRKNKTEPDKTFSFTQLIFFTFSSIKSIVEANWPITSHSHATSNFAQHSTRKNIIITLSYWVAVYTVLIAFINLPMAKKTLRNQYRSSQIEELLPLVQKYQPLFGPSYQISALLSWKTQHFVPKLSGLSRFDFYDTLPESSPKDDQIYVLKHFDSIWPEKYQKYKKIKIETFENLQIELYQFNHE